MEAKCFKKQRETGSTTGSTGNNDTSKDNANPLPEEVADVVLMAFGDLTEVNDKSNSQTNNNEIVLTDENSNNEVEVFNNNSNNNKGELLTDDNN
jgi:hypothetical protein